MHDAARLRLRGVEAHPSETAAPARAAVGVAALPKGAAVEMDAVMVLAEAG